MECIRLVFADDHPLFLSGIQAEIRPQPDLIVVGVAHDGREALELTLSLEPDVLVLDMQLPELDGVEVTRQLRQLGALVRILPLSGFDDKEYVIGMMELGASGYILNRSQ